MVFSTNMHRACVISKINLLERDLYNRVVGAYLISRQQHDDFVSGFRILIPRTGNNLRSMK